MWVKGKVVDTRRCRHTPALRPLSAGVCIFSFHRGFRRYPSRPNVRSWRKLGPARLHLGIPLIEAMLTRYAKGGPRPVAEDGARPASLIRIASERPARNQDLTAGIRESFRAKSMQSLMIARDLAREPGRYATMQRRRGKFVLYLSFAAQARYLTR